MTTEARELSGTTQACLAAVKTFVNEYNYSPSVRDIAKAVGRSTSVAYTHLRRLRQHGWITFDDRLARSIRVLK